MRKPRAIVCDDKETQDLFRNILEEMGYEVLTADTPVTCPIYAENADVCPRNRHCTDILITNYKMPDMTGLELFEMQQNRGCKIKSRNKALIGGDEVPELKKRAAEFGCNFFLRPVQTPSLLEWLKECERVFDPLEPLASDVFIPAKKRPLR